MVDSVDDFKSSRSTQGKTHFPDFDMLDSRIASALNKIIQNSYFKKKVSLKEQKAQKEDRFLRGRQNRRELRRCDLTNSPGMNWDKVTLLYMSSLHKYRSCRKE